MPKIRDPWSIRSSSFLIRGVHVRLVGDLFPAFRKSRFAVDLADMVLKSSLWRDMISLLRSCSTGSSSGGGEEKGKAKAWFGFFVAC